MNYERIVREAAQITDDIIQKQLLDYLPKHGDKALEEKPKYINNPNKMLIRDQNRLKVSQLIQDPSYRKQLGLPDKVMESYQLLAQGEYNVNFKWIHPYTQVHIRSMLDKAWQIQKQNIVPMSYRCCVNTELNNGNFLINGNTKTNYLIDWEKPVYSEPAQDLGHFLAPTTTFWKTDVIFDQAMVDALLKEYIHAVNGRFCLDGLVERTHTYLSVTCMRGITYCAMAWVQYQQPDRLIYNPETKEKLDRYLDDEFLDWIEANYLTS